MLSQHKESLIAGPSDVIIANFAVPFSSDLRNDEVLVRASVTRCSYGGGECGGNKHMQRREDLRDVASQCFHLS